MSTEENVSKRPKRTQTTKNCAVKGCQDTDSTKSKVRLHKTDKLRKLADTFVTLHLRCVYEWMCVYKYIYV